MSEKSSLPKSLILCAIVSVLVIGVPAVLHATLGLPRFWTVLGVLAAVIFVSAVLPPYVISRLSKKRSPSHERIRATRTWQSPKTPENVLNEIDAAFRGRGAITRLNNASMEIKLGSDEEFRKWGIFSVRGRQALPSMMEIHILPNESGSLITVEARDDLGWFIGPLSTRVKQEAKKTVDRRLDQLGAFSGIDRKV